LEQEEKNAELMKTRNKFILYYKSITPLTDGVQGVISQKIKLLIPTAVITSDPTDLWIIFPEIHLHKTIMNVDAFYCLYNP
jgi:hypothetical protein